jgi:hypothetical protein
MKIKFIIKSVIQKETKCICLTDVEDCFICLETAFDPLTNVKQMISLFEYCKPLLASETKEDYFKICDELFSPVAKTDDEIIKKGEFKIVPYDKSNIYDNFCIMDLNEMGYIFVKRYRFMENVFTSGVKDWLELHYPLEQFVDSNNELDKEGMEIRSLIEKVSAIKNLSGLDEDSIAYIY